MTLPSIEAKDRSCPNGQRATACKVGESAFYPIDPSKHLSTKTLAATVNRINNHLVLPAQLLQ
jgi:hypothetical protein